MVGRAGWSVVSRSEGVAVGEGVGAAALLVAKDHHHKASRRLEAVRTGLYHQVR